jgi:hypothetical protein
MKCKIYAAGFTLNFESSSSVLKLLLLTKQAVGKNQPKTGFRQKGKLLSTP